VNCICPGMTDTEQGDAVVGHYHPNANVAETKATGSPFGGLASRRT